VSAQAVLPNHLTNAPRKPFTGPDPAKPPAHLFSSQASGLIVRLPDWTYPVVINTTTGQVR
jgi:hypothetical protein